MFKGVFVDDADEAYAGVMSTPGELEFEFLKVSPLTTQALTIRERNPHVVALDYRLDEVDAGIEAGHTYKGSGLAQLLRDVAIMHPANDFSLVLVSNETKLKAAYDPDKTAHDLFDKVYSKEEVNENRGRVRTELIALARAYETLRQMHTKFDISKILGANELDTEQLDSQELRRSFETAAAPHLIIRQLLRNMIERPAILIDDHWACAMLGINPEDFHLIARALEEAGVLYTGLLGDGWRRWWSGRLEVFSEKIFEDRSSGLTSAERAAKLSDTLGKEIRPNMSPWNGSVDEYPVFACASCGRPSELRHSLAAYDPRAPRYTTRRRICWDCIQKDTYKHLNSPLEVDETDADLVNDVQEMERTEGGK
ncbi:MULTISPECIES: hypothetical protein [Agrobacterium tumefaciens complex]|uniref:Putative Response regulator receiver domain protein n=1 Tax=Agrobacterium tomkonis CFBP 6623 TaxID=1183432 RepID=A0A1S7S338_9HYPH|nr:MULTISPECIES: hypothetical protein [Agrobacterium tumefaciens complex]QCL92323.1 hypothetical protein CFBP6623_24795 [Agrobacterium tumefaciens]CUX61678.1 putative Response regulator receiver domain protein [Agrobacterium tomkonis CFBP 6623]